MVHEYRCGSSSRQGIFDGLGQFGARLSASLRVYGIVSCFSYDETNSINRLSTSVFDPGFKMVCRSSANCYCWLYTVYRIEVVYPETPFVLLYNGLRILTKKQTTLEATETILNDVWRYRTKVGWERKKTRWQLQPIPRGSHDQLFSVLGIPFPHYPRDSKFPL